MNKVLVVAPHPDDETLGCGGTLLKHHRDGDDINWLIATKMNEGHKFTDKHISQRNSEINRVSTLYGFSNVIRLDYICAELDQVPLAQLIDSIGKAIRGIEPNIIYLPWPGDIHSDHRIIFDAMSSFSKWFRYPSIKKILAYQTLSETEYSLDPAYPRFQANVFVDISEFLDKKIEIMRVYSSELGEHPFPRSEDAIKAQALLNGSASGCFAAEGYVLLKELV